MSDRLRAVAPAIARRDAQAVLVREVPRRQRATFAVAAPAIDLVWLPYRRLAAVGRRDNGVCLVCANTGQAFANSCTTDLLDRPPDEMLPARLDASELDRIGRRFLARVANMAGAGADGERELTATDCAWPYWLLAYETRRGRLDFRACDAVDGRPAGGSVRQALIFALAADGAGAAVLG